jgi:hypothetical protein
MVARAITADALLASSRHGRRPPPLGLVKRLSELGYAVELKPLAA